MGKLNAKDALERFKNTENNEFFDALQDDGDTARVRFLYESADPENDDFDLYAVHEVEIDGKKRYIECTGEDDCVGCRETGRPKLKLFLQLIDDDDPDKVKTWERGKQFVPKMIGLIKNYGSLVNCIFEIQRNGKRGDSETTYEIYFIERDNMTLDDLPEKQELLGPDGFVLQKNADEWYDILDDNKPQRRESSSNSYNDRGRSSSRSSSRDNGGSRRESSRGSDRGRGNDRGNDRGGDRNSTPERSRGGNDRRSSSRNDSAGTGGGSRRERRGGGDDFNNTEIDEKNLPF